MSKLLLAFYGDDFTGSTDALEQLTLAGVRTALFIEAPSRARLKQFPGLQAIGVAGTARSLAPAAMRQELMPALKKLKSLGVRHVHYKVCSTFDSSPEIGSIGCVLDVAGKIFRAPFVPLLVAAPALGRYTIFGTHFARYGIGSSGRIHRLDRHPSISHHPVTPMTEADLRMHLAKQTKKTIALFDILQVALPEQAARAALNEILAEKPDVVLFDAIYHEQLARIGSLIDGFASEKRPMFSIGSSGIEAALTACWNEPQRQAGKRLAGTLAPPATQILVGSGSCSPVTKKQIAWAVKNRFAEVALDA
ncbi:MAG TPA: four-carbon acid sugar kinase family protein, partial [Candidatus Polarisedimenticolia bacterium]|nr:four-carbon acid sugar kinase family protein [Candidatus Polarisedimenticolia bacterium]